MEEAESVISAEILKLENGSVTDQELKRVRTQPAEMASPSVRTRWPERCNWQIWMRCTTTRTVSIQVPKN
jgi:hypothetical protein